MTAADLSKEAQTLLKTHLATLASTNACYACLTEASCLAHILEEPISDKSTTFDELRNDVEANYSFILSANGSAKPNCC
jgi:hypothetical protein